MEIVDKIKILMLNIDDLYNNDIYLKYKYLKENIELLFPEIDKIEEEKEKYKMLYKSLHKYIKKLNFPLTLRDE